MKLLFVSGSIPNMPCGVGDYSLKLINALKKKGNTKIKVLTSNHEEVNEIQNVEIKKISSDWSLLGTLSNLFKYFRKDHFDLIHVQYPTTGYKKGLGVFSVFLYSKVKKIPIVLTLHEFSRFHYLKKGLFSLILSIMSSHIILTTKNEYDVLIKRGKLFRLSRKTTIIPIGSNIPAVNTKKTIKLDTICFFGFLYADKQIPSILNTIRMAKNKNIILKLRVIGSEHPDSPGELNKLKQLVMKMNLDEHVEFFIEKPSEIVAELISECIACVLPYKDGVSLRRGSLLAALEQDCVVISNIGEHTPEIIKNKKNILLAETEEEILESVEFLKGNPNKREEIAKNARETLLADRSWEEIGSRHSDVFRIVTNNKSM
ncbi:glycosyltransferase family 4 protein [Niallia alba]|uniref:glycosyltransferase family 4 protein n=1 Tax=Niallia alba TaxID=2729105 RepID=UPI002E1A8C1E|nr:glycosyltransferase family 4 protein [Niallia alba]